VNNVHPLFAEILEKHMNHPPKWTCRCEVCTEWQRAYPAAPTNPNTVAGLIAGNAVTSGYVPVDMKKCAGCGDRRHPSDLVDGLCPECEEDEAEAIRDADIATEWEEETDEPA